ncbi:hypothetical protein AQ611_01925 [Burkholderia singularis]|nr:hypothetical protein AQ611_01925 [Burkholderia sp. Bp7605]
MARAVLLDAADPLAGRARPISFVAVCCRSCPGGQRARPDARGVDIKEHRRNVRAAARNPPRFSARFSPRPQPA